MTSAQNKPKLWQVTTVAFFAFLLGNFTFETIITLVESSQTVRLYEVFPFTRIVLLVLTIVLTRKYWKKQGGK